MSSSADSEMKNIDTNVKTMTNFVDKLTTKLSTYFTELDKHYTSYLKILKSSTFSNTSPTTPNTISPPGYSFKYVDSEYQKIRNKLQKIIESMGSDFLQIFNLTDELKDAYNQMNGLKDNINRNEKLPNSLEKKEISDRLHAKYIKKVMNYNKLVADFNAYGSKLTATQQYLKNDLIIYSPNLSKKKYSLSIKQILNWFKDLATPDGVAVLRGEIIARMTQNYTSDLNTLINTPPLTSISVMDPYSTIQRPTSNQPPGTPKSTYRSYPDTSLMDPSTQIEEESIPGSLSGRKRSRVSLPDDALDIPSEKSRPTFPQIDENIEIDSSDEN